MSELSIPQSELQLAKDAVSEAKVVLLLGHVNPDADAIGAILGFGIALENAGKHVLMAVDGGVPRELCFLPKAENVLSDLPDNLHIDLIIAMDSDDLSVLGNCGARAFQLQVPKLIIDHHNFNEMYGTIHLVQPDFVSTTELIVEFLKFLEWDIPSDAADPLLLGMMSDTQLFKTRSIKARTFEIAGKLVASGANYERLIEKNFASFETGYLKLLSYVLGKAVLEDHVYWTRVTPEDFRRYGLKKKPRFYVVDDLINDEEAFIAATFQLVDTGNIRVSIRSKSGFDVGRIANKLGGGGHFQSAGCTLSLESIDQAVSIVIPLLKAEIKRVIFTKNSQNGST